MKQYFSDLQIRLMVFGFILAISGVFSDDASAKGFNVSVGSTIVDISNDTRLISTSIDIALENSTADALQIAGYSFFLEIEPIGNTLPIGVTFDTPAATYSSGNGAGFLLGASTDGTINLSPAAGDIGLGQIQFFDASLSAGGSENLLTVNFLVDPGSAVAGGYAVSISTEGQNSISSINNTNQTFTSSAGILSLNVSEPMLGDVDLSGVVNFLDITPFIAILSTSGFQAEVDIDQNEVVNFLDISPFIAILSGL